MHFAEFLLTMKAIIGMLFWLFIRDLFFYFLGCCRLIVPVWLVCFQELALLQSHLVDISFFLRFCEQIQVSDEIPEGPSQKDSTM